MLPKELLRYYITEHTIVPKYITRKYAGYYLKVAKDVIKIYRNFIGKTRGELDATLDEYEGEHLNYKVMRGFAKILDGFAEFAPAYDVDYVQLREQVFEGAQRHRPIVHEPDILHKNTKEVVLKKLGLELSPEEISRALYGDLSENRVLIRIEKEMEPEELIRRYNLTLAQGILYRAVKMWVKLWDSYKTVFKYLKLARLMNFISKEEDGYGIIIDGPLSLFRRTLKYGVNMARFLPGLMLASRWELRAEIVTEAGRKLFHLNQDCGLHSYYKGENLFDSSVEEAFYRDFTKRKTEWGIERETEIIDLGRTVFIPDFTLCYPDGRRILLEIVGFWTPEYLQKKLEKLQKANCSDLIIAVDEGLNCAREDFRGDVLFFKNRVKVDEVMERLERKA